MIRHMLAGAALACSAWVGTAPANADAFGIEPWGAFTFNGTSWPKGVLYHRIVGKGYHVYTDQGSFASVGNLCDAGFVFTYGNGARRSRSAVLSGCTHAGNWEYTPNKDMPGGEACVELWIQNWRRMVARQCHYISP
jgi:hypothetical protein